MSQLKLAGKTQRMNSSPLCPFVQYIIALENLLTDSNVDLIQKLPKVHTQKGCLIRTICGLTLKLLIKMAMFVEGLSFEVI